MNLLFISGPEILMVLFLVLLFFGAKAIPEVAKMMGKGYREFKKATDDIKKEFDNYSSDISKEIKDVSSTVKKGADSVSKNIDKLKGK